MTWGTDASAGTSDAQVSLHRDIRLLGVLLPGHPFPGGQLSLGDQRRYVGALTAFLFSRENLVSTARSAIFFIGAFVGIVIMMVAVWRSRALPRPAAALVIAFQVAGFVPLSFPTTVLAAAGFFWMAIALLRSGRATAGAAPELS